MQRRTAGTVAFLATGLTLGLATSAGAAGLDTTLGTAGVSFTPLSAVASDRYQASAPAPDGGTYNAGYTTVSGTNRAFAITKTLPNGQLDAAFGNGGLAVVDVAPGPFLPGPAINGNPAQAAPTGAGETARGIGVQPNGKIVVLGQAETVQNGSKPDSRDIDPYVARLNANGTLDSTFGTNGITRIDLSDGRNVIPGTGSASTLSSDQAGYNVVVRPDGQILLTLSKGVDSSTPARLDRDIVIAQLKANGVLDPAFGTGGLAPITNPDVNVNENPRRGLLLADGKYVTTAYGPVGGQNRPFLIRVDANGAPDTTFGPNGVATANVAGATGRAEAYGIKLQGGKYVVVGYGARDTNPNNGSDVLVFRFNTNGTWDQTFGTNGLVDYDRLVPGADPATPAGHYSENGRNIEVLPDDRIVALGQSGPDALALVLKADGTPDTSVSPTGAVVTDLGGTADALWGATIAKGTGYKVVASGYSGFAAADAANEDSALVALDLTPPAAPVIPNPTVPTTPTTPTTPTVPTTPTTPKPAKTVGKVTVSAKRTGAKKNRVRVTLKLQRFGKGKVTVSAKRKAKGAKSVSAKGTLSSKGTLTVTLKTGKKGRYTLTIKVVVLHDRRVPRTHANIDHIAIAPSGIWVIDTKR
ncbi:NERD domain-containing protein, partial [Patulibacter sp. NPDC049589]|uniref:NERD domain-containing protein n=1 Tax=Patulibacter sp. NPDC049589 TaxID=3154731 RepID=UPI00341C4DF0